MATEINATPKLIGFTAIGFYECSGQIWCEHVYAACMSAAYAEAARLNPTITMVAMLQGIHSEGDFLGFPGVSVVDAETILMQPGVFG